MDSAQTCLQVGSLVNERQIYNYATGNNAIGKLDLIYENITIIEIEGYTSGSFQDSKMSLLSPNLFLRPPLCQTRARDSISPVAIPD